jgi:hypothetical protein
MSTDCTKQGTKPALTDLLYIRDVSETDQKQSGSGHSWKPPKSTLGSYGALIRNVRGGGGRVSPRYGVTLVPRSDF